MKVQFYIITNEVSNLIDLWSTSLATPISLKTEKNRPFGLFFLRRRRDLDGHS